jgi:hypothetical protein
MNPFNYIQSFIINSSKVNNSTQVFVTSLDLYFRNKPPATNNSSGINFPGVNAHICPFVGENPNPDEVIQNITARVEWGGVSVVADATVPTKLVFPTPIILKTDTYYGIVVSFDDNDYELFLGVQDEIILNTTKKYSGSAGEGDGKLYVQGADDTLKPLSDRDIKFELKIAQFNANTVTVELCNDDYEFFTCNNMTTAQKFKGGEFVFPNYGRVANATVNTIFSQVGTVVTTAANDYITGTNTLFTNSYSIGDYLVLTNTSNTNQQEIVRISSIIDDTNIVLENEIGFSNTCWHNKVVTGLAFERDYVKKTLTLSESNASNASFRFHTNGVQYFTISNPGGSYANTDTIRVSNGSVNATGVLITNATGNVVSIRMTTAGGGFPNVSHSVVTITTSTGSGASIVPVINTPLKGVTSRATADLVSINNIAVEIVDPEVTVQTTSASYANLTYSIANGSGYIQSFSAADLTSPIDVSYAGRIYSRSNELSNPTNLYNLDKSSLVRLNMGVNVANVTATPTYVSPYVYDDDINNYIFSNEIDSTTANTESEIGRGSLKSKHITRKITLANNSFAEDIRVYINAYRPANTNILLYAKIHNSQDNEPYDDKSWSPLELVSGQNQVSGTRNKDDVKEFEYGFPQYPAVRFTCNTTATTSLSNNVVLTTTDLTSNLATGDLVRVYNPLFSTTNYLVSPVASVNSTAVVLQDTIANSGLVGSSLKIDKLKFKNVAYNNVLNDNVVRYFTTSMSPVDGYDSLSIKMIFLADNKDIVPEVDDIRVIAVSA